MGCSATPLRLELAPRRREALLGTRLGGGCSCSGRTETKARPSREVDAARRKHDCRDDVCAADVLTQIRYLPQPLGGSCLRAYAAATILVLLVSAHLHLHLHWRGSLYLLTFLAWTALASRPASCCQLPAAPSVLPCQVRAPASRGPPSTQWKAHAASSFPSEIQIPLLRRSLGCLAGHGPVRYRQPQTQAIHRPVASSGR